MSLQMPLTGNWQMPTRRRDAYDIARKMAKKMDESASSVLGAGDSVAESAIESFKSRGSQAITVTGRTFDWCPLSRRKPDELAEKFGGFALSFDDFKKSLHFFDVILTSTASGKALIDLEDIRECMRKRPSQPLFLIDAAVPRNIDERASKVDNVFLYNMDDVSDIANENLKSRMAEVDHCKSALGQRALRLWQQMTTTHSKEPASISQSTAPRPSS